MMKKFLTTLSQWVILILLTGLSLLATGFTFRVLWEALVFGWSIGYAL